MDEECGFDASEELAAMIPALRMFARNQMRCGGEIEDRGILDERHDHGGAMSAPAFAPGAG